MTQERSNGLRIGIERDDQEAGNAFGRLERRKGSSSCSHLASIRCRWRAANVLVCVERCDWEMSAFGRTKRVRDPHQDRLGNGASFTHPVERAEVDSRGACSANTRRRRTVAWGAASSDRSRVRALRASSFNRSSSSTGTRSELDVADGAGGSRPPPSPTTSRRLRPGRWIDGRSGSDG